MQTAETVQTSQLQNTAKVSGKSIRQSSITKMPLNFAANISMMFTEIPSFAGRYAAAKKAGFKAVECLFPFNQQKEEIAAARAQAGLEHVLVSSFPGDIKAGELGLAALPGRQKDFRDTFELSVEFCKALECKRMHVMSAVIPSHEAGQRSKLLADMEDTLVENLKYASDRLQKEGIVALIEPINEVYTIPNYFLTSFEHAVKILERVGRDNVKLQLDVYHVQVLTGNLTKTIEKYLPYTGHMQISQVPGRNEPSLRGEIDYDYVFSLLESLGYDGWIGAEYKPSTEKTEDSLAWFERYK